MRPGVLSVTPSQPFAAHAVARREARPFTNNSSKLLDSREDWYGNFSVIGIKVPFFLGPIFEVGRRKPRFPRPSRHIYFAGHGHDWLSERPDLPGRQPLTDSCCRRSTVYFFAALSPPRLTHRQSVVGSARESSDSVLGQAHFRRALELFGRFTNRGINGFIASEAGQRAVTYGLQEPVHTGIRVVDAPWNGRARAVGAVRRRRERRRAAAVPQASQADAEKKTAHAAEQDRPDVLKRREDWFESQLDLDPGAPRLP